MKISLSKKSRRWINLIRAERQLRPTTEVTGRSWINLIKAERQLRLTTEMTGSSRLGLMVAVHGLMRRGLVNLFADHFPGRAELPLADQPDTITIAANHLSGRAELPLRPDQLGLNSSADRLPSKKAFPRRHFKNQGAATSSPNQINISANSSMISLAGRLAAILILVGLFSSCAIGPHYKRPPVNQPETFRGDTQNATNSFADLPWWQIFPDENLQRLIRVALTNNYDLRIAVTRVEQARQVVNENRAALFPQIGYAGDVGRGKNVANNTVSPTGLSGTVSGGDVNAAWQIDLWGRIRKLTESARAQYFATEEARRDIMRTLVAQVAQDYLQLLSLDRQLSVATNSTNSYGQSLTLFNNQLKGGIASKLETSSAEALLDSAAATIPDLERQIAIQENAISVLLGQNMGPVVRGDSVLEKQTGLEVPAGLPSSLLERRPDVREAEQQLRSANALVGVAQANFLPQLELTGLFGRVSPGLAVFSGGGSVAWEAAAGLTGPIFQGGYLTAQYRQSLAVRSQYALQYQSTVLTALQEVSNALISGTKYEQVQAQQVRAVAAYREAVRIATERYRLGQSSYYEVLQEQQLLFPAENILVQSKANELLSVIQLYSALGGGWQTVTNK